MGCNGAMKEKKRKKGKAIITAGIVSLIFLPAAVLFFLVVFFPDFPETYILTVFYLPVSLSVIVTEFGVAVRREEKKNGQAPKKNVFKLLTPAQRALVISLLLFAAVSVTVEIANTFATVCMISFFITLVLSVVLFFKSVIKNVRMRGRKPHTPPKPLTVNCVKCGIEMKNDGSALLAENRYYCRSCYTLMKEKMRKAEQPDHAVCTVCGRNFPKGDMHLVDGQYFCPPCFQKKFASGEKEKSAGTVIPAFDYDAFRKNYGSYIAARIPANIENAAVQGALLETLHKVVPSVKSGLAGSFAGGRQLAPAVNQWIGETDFAGIEQNWAALSNEEMIDAFVLLDFYSYLLNPEDSANLRAARERIGIVLQIRLTTP